MKIQNSYQHEMKTGTLYIVPTPIGNLDDITIRALQVLKEADLIAAEDTRNTGRLLQHFKIKRKMISYHEHNKAARQDQMLDILREGQSIAVVSDAGMPGISDPGQAIVQAVAKEELPVVVLPGANAALCALVGSGLSTDQFYFYGFLPRKKKIRQSALKDIEKVQATVLLYESPHRLQETIEDLYQYFGDRKACIARELTKRYEEWGRGTLSELKEWTEQNKVKGECCIILDGVSVKEEGNWWDSLSLSDHVEKVMEEEGSSSKDAIKIVSKTRDIPKREVYQAFHIDK
ncbi:16S rRNA (cytidine(1402)-2'-O)-methyltransferase [Gracilibacillus sp. YIM 98692]|uniref:16S rRNA (cytidine(1402)-2'-O)-methyltransferase n=1 Tax=Gracilibacillus sp. YIM 98692 TaxID=2663532 RepID=UPI0013D00AC1|nr:16S rRNA (cytidine(1402)-2'-O)-methyltransferase [Gracilibacillus sp. YIM 98692]